MFKSTFFAITLFLLIQIGESVDYLSEAQKWVDKVYNQIVAVGCKHDSPPAKKYEDIQSTKKINCAASASITYQQAGLIDAGKLVSHTAAVGKDIVSHYNVADLKKSLGLSVQNYGNLKKGTCDLVKVMKTFEDMPAWLQKKGIMYIQDSNICISAGNKKIYSCNSTGKTYSKNGVNPLRTEGYAFTSPILWAVVPRSNGKSNVDSTTTLKHLAC